MATLVMSPLFEYGNFKSSPNSALTHKGHSLQGRKSPVISSSSNHSRRNSTTSSHLLSDCPPHRHEPMSPSSQKTSHHSSDGRKLERALSEPSSERRLASSQQSSNSSRYKTELCRPYEENGTCKYGDKCQFAHGIKELRTLARHPKYKTELCRSFHTTGLCPYGPRCHFIHNSDQRKVNLVTSMTPGSGNNSLPMMAASRPKALSSSSLGSAGELSPPSSHSGSPTLMKSTDDLFQFPSVFYMSGSDFQPVSPASTTPVNHHQMQQQRSFHEYTTHEFNPDFYDTPSIFQERHLSSVFGSPVTTAPNLDLDPASFCGSRNLDSPRSDTPPFLSLDTGSRNLDSPRSYSPPMLGLDTGSRNLDSPRSYSPSMLGLHTGSRNLDSPRSYSPPMLSLDTGSRNLDSPRSYSPPMLSLDKGSRNLDSPRSYSPPFLSLDTASLCGSPNLDSFTPGVDTPLLLNNTFNPFQVFSLFGKQDN